MSDTENAHFRDNDLPLLIIPDELGHSSSYESASDSESGQFAGSTPISTPVNFVGSFGFEESDETSTSPVSTPKPKRKRFPQRFTSKRQGVFRTPSKVRAKDVSAFKPSSSLLKGCPIPKSTVPFNVKLNYGGKVSSRPLTVPTGSQVMDMQILRQVFCLIRCQDPTCTGSLDLHKYPFTNGLQSYFVLHCKRCHAVVSQFSTSPHLDESPSEAVNNPRMFVGRRQAQVNARSLVALHTTSLSWQDFRLACALLDIPVPQRNMNKLALQTLTDFTVNVSNQAMDIAAAEVRNRSDAEQSVINGATRCHVSYDGSWHQRGHYSNQGFGAAIDSTSGKVLDYGLLQRVCPKCVVWSEERRSNFPEEYSTFKESHADCSINFTGSSQAMEGAIAVDLWNRSLERNRLVYCTYIGDGDSSSYKQVVKSDPYKGLESVRKEECLGHVQKRLKKHLAKKSDTFPAIPRTKVERIGQLYALVVVQNRGKSPEDIRQALWTLIAHLGEDHTTCPASTTSWCYHARAQADFAMDPTVSLPSRRKPHWSDSEVNRLTEVLKVFASTEMCGALTMGKTQNANESLHSVVWHNSPKGKYVGQKSIICSTALAVAAFNEGSLSLAAILREYGIIPSCSTIRHLAERDNTRNIKRKRAILQTQRRRRRHLDVRSKAAESSRHRREKAASKYSKGKFGTERLHLPTAASDEESGEESDTTCAKCSLRNCSIGRPRKNDEWIGCELCERWFHGRCIGVQKVSAFTDSPFFCRDCEVSS